MSIKGLSLAITSSVHDFKLKAEFELCLNKTQVLK